MAEHLLNGTQIGSSFKKMGSERMAQCVRGYFLNNTGQFGKLFDYVENHYAGKPSATAIEEKNVFLS